MNADSPVPSTSSSFAKKYGWTLCACVITTLIATPLAEYLDPANIVMLFLLTVLLIAVRFGRGPAVLAAFLSVALFDFFFVPPRLSFTVNDAQYLVTFSVMLAAALITGQLAAGLRRQADIASLKERQTRALYEMARDLGGALTIMQVSEIVKRFLRDEFGLDTVLLLPDEHDRLMPTATPDSRLNIDLRFAQIALEQCEPFEDHALSGYGHGASYFPLKAPMKVRGVIVFVADDRNADALPEQKPLLATVSSVVAIAIERLHYVAVAQTSQVQIISERLRSSILSALSHDLRTPLTILVGLADSLALSKTQLPAEARETAGAIADGALRMSSLVENLLEMARLHAGRVTLSKEWQFIEEVIGASTKLLERALAQHQIRIILPRDMPLVKFDAVLIERVCCNLLENAAKYAPPGSTIEITGKTMAGSVEISICDQGPGFSADKLHTLFEMFERGVQESATPGVGLGLAICRAIIEAHDGAIHAANRPEGGACVTFTLPKGTPPTIDEESGT